MPKLYELADQYRHLVADNVDSQTGEIVALDAEAFFALLDGIKESIGDKAENIGKLWLELRGGSKLIATEIERLSKHKARLESNSQWLEDYLLRELPLAGIERVERPSITVVIRDNPPSVKVTNEELVPRDFKRHVPELWEVDKKSILENYKAGGQPVEGTEIIIDKKRIDIK